MTTYDTVLTSTNNYNATQQFWYHRFIGDPQPGSQCSSYNLSIGQEFSTTNNLLTYTLGLIEGDKKVLPYKALPLQECDVISAYVGVDLPGTTVTVSAYVACNSSEIQMVAKTQYVYSLFDLSLDSSVWSPAQEAFGISDANRQRQISYISDRYVITQPDRYLLLTHDYVEPVFSLPIVIQRCSVQRSRIAQCSFQNLPSGNTWVLQALLEMECYVLRRRSNSTPNVVVRRAGRWYATTVPYLRSEIDHFDS